MYVTLTKKSIAVVLAAVVLALILIGQLLTVSSGSIDASTNEKRVQYLKSLGFSVDETAQSVKETVLPMEFGDVYKKYNNLQRKAGFDLSNYRGKTVMVYTYLLLQDGETAVHLMVCDGKVIGGDIASLKIDGEMKPLSKG